MMWSDLVTSLRVGLVKWSFELTNWTRVVVRQPVINALRMEVMKTL